MIIVAAGPRSPADHRADDRPLVETLTVEPRHGHAVAQHHHLVAVLPHLGQSVRDHEDGQASVGGASHAIEESRCVGRGQGCRRLVQDQHRRVDFNVAERDGERHQRSFAGVQASAQARRVDIHAELAESTNRRFGEFLPADETAQSGKAEIDRNRFGHREICYQRRFLVDHADAAPSHGDGIERVAGEDGSADADAPARTDRVDPGQSLDGG